MTNATTTLAACLLLALGDAAAQSVPLLRTTPGGGSDLVSVDEAGPTTTVLLEDVTILPLGLAGRPRSERFRADRPTPRSDDLAPSVRLPEQGSLYRMQTPGATHLVLVRPDGGVDVLLTRPSSDEPSLLGRVAASDDGSHVLAASTLDADGDVFALTLDATPSLELLTPGPAVSVAADSLRISTTAAWFVAGGRVRRAVLGSGGSQSVSATYAPDAVVLTELAMASNGRHAAWLSETPDGNRHVWAAELSGAAVRQTDVSADYATPGYDDPAGPWLAVDGGSRWVAWCRAMPKPPVGTSDEVFVRRITSATPGDQLTADVDFVDTIDSIGGLGFVAEGRLAFFAGEPADEPGQLIGSADLYLADLTAPGPVTNLTMTSGLSAAPFSEPGELEILDVFSDPLGDRRLLLVDPDGGDFGLLAQPADGGPLAPLLPALDVLPSYAPAGDSLLAQIVTGPGSGQLVLLRPDGTADAVAATSPLLVIDRLSVSRDGLQAAFVASAGPDLEFGLRLDLATAGLELLWPTPLHWAPRMAFTGSGNLAAGLGLFGGPFLFVAFDGPASGTVLPGGVGTGFPLDG